MTADARNAKFDPISVFSKDGEEVKTTRLNALDLTRSGAYFWQPPGTASSADETEAVLAGATVEDFSLEVAAEPDEALEEAPTAYLAEEAMTVAGTDPEEYLNGFSQSALKEMLEEKYGQKVHGRTGKEKLIQMIIELDAAQDLDEE